jgi:hypothetical protein
MARSLRITNGRPPTTASGTLQKRLLFQNGSVNSDQPKATTPPRPAVLATKRDTDMKIVWEARIPGLHGCTIEGTTEVDYQGSNDLLNRYIEFVIWKEIQKKMDLKYSVVDDDPKTD